MESEKKVGNFALRMPEQLREAVRLHAGSNNRSMNAEILYLIEKGMKGTPALDLSNIHDWELLREVNRRFTATYAVKIELTEAQLTGIKKFNEVRDTDGDLLEDADDLHLQEPE